MIKKNFFIDILAIIFTATLLGAIPAIYSHGVGATPPTSSKRQSSTKPHKTTSNPVFYYNHNDQLVAEQNPHLDHLAFIYGNTTCGALYRAFMKQPFVSKAIGLYQDSSYSRKDIAPFIKTYHIDMSVYEPDSYASFNEFFHRKIKPEARPINKEAVIVAPGDGKLWMKQNITHATRALVKGQLVNIAEIFGTEIAEIIGEGGTLVILRITPKDYHRVHFPVDCRPSMAIELGHVLESVNKIAYNAHTNPLQNKRQVLLLHTNNPRVGPVGMAFVGAMGVGKIVRTYTPNKAYKKGDEAGYFDFGGSTVVLLFRKDAQLVFPAPYIERSAHGYESEINTGEALAYK